MRFSTAEHDCGAIRESRSSRAVLTAFPLSSSGSSSVSSVASLERYSPHRSSTVASIISLSVTRSSRSALYQSQAGAAVRTRKRPPGISPTRFLAAPICPPRAFGAHPLDTDCIERHPQFADVMGPQVRTVRPCMQPARLSHGVRGDQRSLRAGAAIENRCRLRPTGR